MAAEGELTLVTLRLRAADPERLAAVLAKYVVVGRGHPGCRNIDLCVSVTRPDEYLVVEKWADATAQQAHLDSDAMVEMARACTGLLQAPPDIDLWDAASAHDLG